MFSFELVFATLLVVRFSNATVFKRSSTPVYENGTYRLTDRDIVDGFSNHQYFSFESGNLPSGLSPSNYPIDETYGYSEENWWIEDSYLWLMVPGGQTKKPYTCAQVTTTEDRIRYASVRTVAVFAEERGVCNGIFFYASDTQETDFEWLTDPTNESDQGTHHLWLTNQANDGNPEHSTSIPVSPPAEPYWRDHEYRIDWTEGLTQWYVDGLLVGQTTENVPSEPGQWIFNNWANGDKGWTAGPPVGDAFFKIKSIDIYYNTA